MKQYTCAAWTPTGIACGEPARFYPCGPRCDPHSPWAIHGRTLPKPDPQWTAQGFLQHKPAMPGQVWPEECDHGEPKGPRYCGLCRKMMKEGTA